MASSEWPPEMRSAFEAGRTEEREACARIAEEQAARYDVSHPSWAGAVATATWIAGLIRARNTS